MKKQFLIFAVLLIATLAFLGGCAQQKTVVNNDDGTDPQKTLDSVLEEKKTAVEEKIAEEKRKLETPSEPKAPAEGEKKGGAVEPAMEKEEQIPEPAETGAKEYVVKITDTAYEPSEVKLKQGDSVKWVNESSTQNWPATAKHPTHEVYPGSSITKCGSADESQIFDACKGIKPGESYSFTFNEKGPWAYHEHINVKMFGKIVVE